MERPGEAEPIRLRRQVRQPIVIQIGDVADVELRPSGPVHVTVVKRSSLFVGFRSLDNRALDRENQNDNP